MEITLNGFVEEVDPNVNLNQLILQFEEQEEALIVEVNGRFIHKRDYETWKINPGDRVEMIHPAFGG